MALDAIKKIRNTCREDVYSPQHETRETMIRTYDGRLVSFHAPILHRERRSPLPRFPLDRASRRPPPAAALRSSLAEQRIRHDVTSGRNVCAGRLLCGKERCEIRLAVPRGWRAKTSFVRLFRGKVFRDESTRLAHTNGRTGERTPHSRSWILDYILARRCSWMLRYNQERFHCVVESAALRLECCS